MKGGCNTVEIDCAVDIRDWGSANDRGSPVGATR